MGVEHGKEALADTLTETQVVTDAARDAIARTRAVRDELLVLASHDIKNAVGILDSALGMTAEMPEQAASMQGMMRRATHRLGILVQALVDVDLLQRDAMPLRLADTGWNAIATTVVEGALGIAATKDVTLAPAGDLAARLACDAVMVQRMVGALLEYAIANAPAKSAVDVEGVRLEGGRFRIRIVHRGRPIGSVTLDKLFTTLPLRFCRLAAIRHGALLRAVSPAVDDGSGLAFELELP